MRTAKGLASLRAGRAADQGTDSKVQDRVAEPKSSTGLRRNMRNGVPLAPAGGVGGRQFLLGPLPRSVFGAAAGRVVQAVGRGAPDGPFGAGDAASAQGVGRGGFRAGDGPVDRGSMVIYV
jgi:hypothetical protein